MSKQPSLIHIKYDYTEAKEGKKDILASQINLIETLKCIKEYKNLRSQELRKKIEISKKIKGIKSDIIQLEKILPKLRIPKILKKELPSEPIVEEHEHVKTISRPKISSSSPLEKQLEEIKLKLQRLQEE